MYLFKDTNGNIREAYEGFDPSNPDWNAMQGVAEVLYVSKTYVPQMKLVVKKPEESSGGTSSQTSSSPGKGKKKK